MPHYPVLDPLKSGGVRHLPGDTVELSEADAETLQKLGVVGQALPDEAEDAKKAAPGADGTGQAAPSGSKKQK